VLEESKDRSAPHSPITSPMPCNFLEAMLIPSSQKVWIGLRYLKCSWIHRLWYL